MIAILTGLHVLAHGIFGCCDHGLPVTSLVAKVHSCGHAPHDVSPELSTACCHATLDGEAAEGQSPYPHECVHESCHWLAGNAGPKISKSDFSLQVPLTAISVIAAPATPTLHHGVNLATIRDTAPPLRLHLALGVLLV